MAGHPNHHARRRGTPVAYLAARSPSHCPLALLRCPTLPQAQAAAQVAQQREREQAQRAAFEIAQLTREATTLTRERVFLSFVLQWKSAANCEK